MEGAKHRTQLSLENRQYQELLMLSRKTGKSLSCIIREMLDEHLAKRAADVQKDPLWDIIGLGSGDGAPVAREHDRLLYGASGRRDPDGNAVNLSS